jgi:hypothetical protein
VIVGSAADREDFSEWCRRKCVAPEVFGDVWGAPNVEAKE